MQMSVAIAGAGIAGLAAAALIAARGHAVTVFDQFEQPKPIGSGLVIQPVGLQVLDTIGLGEIVRAHGQKITRMLGHDSDSQRPVLDVWYDRHGSGAQFGLAIHRASLFQALLDAAKTAGATLIAGHKIKRLETGYLRVSDGTRLGQFDLIVDASGAGSDLSPIKTTPLPYGAIWGTVPWPEQSTLPQDQLTQCYRRASRMMGVLPCGQMPGQTEPQAAIFWSLPRDGYDQWRTQTLAAWKEEATRLWPDIAPFLDTISHHEQMTMARYSHGSLSNPVKERLAIIGDSAHRASPQLGQGANMALLDAMALAQALSLERDLETALQHYAQARRWHVRLYQSLSWAFTPQYQSDSLILPWIRDHLLFPLSKIPPAPALLTRLVCGHLIPPLGSLATDQSDR